MYSSDSETESLYNPYDFEIGYQASANETQHVLFEDKQAENMLSRRSWSGLSGDINETKRSIGQSSSNRRSKNKDRPRLSH